MSPQIARIFSTTPEETLRRMSTKQKSQLPTEVMLMIAELTWSTIEHDEEGDALLPRQRRMYNFCLVSRQWYSAGISYLYACPELRTWNSLVKFTNTLSPPVSDHAGAERNLGSMVYILKLGHLRNQNFNDLVARLLSSSNLNLISFVAPRSPLGIDTLMALSTCKRLEHLDLSPAVGAIQFRHLKEAMSSLHGLISLSLPTDIKVSYTDSSSEDWPMSLRSIKFSGMLDAEAMSKFQWPSHPFKLTLCHCAKS